MSDKSENIVRQASAECAKAAGEAVQAIAMKARCCQKQITSKLGIVRFRGQDAGLRAKAARLQS